MATRGQGMHRGGDTSREGSSGRGSSGGSAPILVTGMPRSGTTWLARLCACAPGTALAGREPMNPRGRQYALAGTLNGWARLESPSRRQRFALLSTYAGVNPLGYSRYGSRQWAAPLPWTRLIVKDPFALLSIPAVQRVTGASVVLIYRHPGAALASYRRMGWRPDVNEMRPIVSTFLSRQGTSPGVKPPPAFVPDTDAAVDRGNENHEAALMAWFWNALYGIALHDLEQQNEQVTVLAHEDVATGGKSFAQTLFTHLGLAWSDAVADQLQTQKAAGSATQSASVSQPQSASLHNFDRDPARVASEWQSRVTSSEREYLDAATHEVLQLLRARAFRT